MAINNLWTPQQEQKLQAWHRMQQVVDLGEPSPCFTIAREFGCEAYPLAEELTKRLNDFFAAISSNSDLKTR